MFQKVTLQGAALILFKFCLISEAQPHSSNSTSHPIYQFTHFLISSFSHFLIFSFPHFLILSFPNSLIFSFPNFYRSFGIFGIISIIPYLCTLINHYIIFYPFHFYFSKITGDRCTAFFRSGWFYRKYGKFRKAHDLWWIQPD